MRTRQASRPPGLQQQPEQERPVLPAAFVKVLGMTFATRLQLELGGPGGIYVNMHPLYDRFIYGHKFVKSSFERHRADAEKDAAPALGIGFAEIEAARPGKAKCWLRMEAVFFLLERMKRTATLLHAMTSEHTVRCSHMIFSHRHALGGPRGGPRE